jgi:hypothetical protein
MRFFGSLVFRLFGLTVGFGLSLGLCLSAVGQEPFSIVSMTLDDEALARAHDVELSGNLAFVPGKGGSTAILDVADPAHPEILWYLRDEELTPDSETVLVVGDHLLLGTKNFHVLDVSKPSKAKVLKTVRDPKRIDRINGMIMVGDVVIAANKEGFVDAFDVSEMANPTLLGAMETRERYGIEKPHDIDRYGDYIVIVDPVGFAPPVGRLAVFKVIEGGVVLPVDEWKLAGRIEGEDLIGANRAQVAGTYAFVGGSWMPSERVDGALPKFSVVDLSDAAMPEVVATLPFRSERGPNGLTVAGKVVFCAGGQRVEAYDVSDPRKPKHLGGQSFPIYQEAKKTDNYHDLIYRDGYLYVSAQSDNGFLILKVEDERMRKLAEAK